MRARDYKNSINVKSKALEMLLSIIVFSIAFQVGVVQAFAGDDTFTVGSIIYAVNGENTCEVVGYTDDIDEYYKDKTSSSNDDSNEEADADEEDDGDDEEEYDDEDDDEEYDDEDDDDDSDVPATLNPVIPSTVTWQSKSYRVTSIGDKAFYGCDGINSITVPYSVESVGDKAFYGCRNAKINILLGKLDQIGDYAFAKTGRIEEFYLNTFTQYGVGVFAGCEWIQHVTIPEGFENIPEAMFADCNNLTTIKMDGVKSISKSAFEGTSLAQVTLPNSLTYIDARAFADCKKLVEIEIPENVTEVGVGAFYGCSNINKVVLGKESKFESTIPTVRYNAFKGISAKCVVNVPQKLAVKARTMLSQAKFPENTQYLGLNEIGVNGVKLNKEEMTIGEGYSQTLTATIDPIDATYKDVIWSSSNSNIASVNNGVVKGKTTGTATITATSKFGKLRATCTVTVKRVIKVNYYSKEASCKLVSTVSVLEDSSLGKLPSIKRKGYNFAFWTTDKDDDIDDPECNVNSKTIVDLEELEVNAEATSINIYGLWKKVSTGKTRLTSVSNSKSKCLTAKWNKVSGAKGYEVYYSKSSSFSGKKSAIVTTNSYTAKNLTKNKKYYVKVRAYKFDSTGSRVYGAWSDVKSVTIKK